MHVPTEIKAGDRLDKYIQSHAKKTFQGFGSREDNLKIVKKYLKQIGADVPEAGVERLFDTYLSMFKKGAGK